MFDVPVTVHRVKFLIIKPTSCINFTNLFLKRNSTCIGQFLCPSSGVFHCTHSNGICRTGLLTACEQDQGGTPWGSILILLACCQQTCMTYTIAVCTMKNSWWWTEGSSIWPRMVSQGAMPAGPKVKKKHCAFAPPKPKIKKVALKLKKGSRNT